jgi:hypothetical protein
LLFSIIVGAGILLSTRGTINIRPWGRVPPLRYSLLFFQTKTVTKRKLTPNPTKTNKNHYASTQIFQKKRSPIE